MTDKKMTPEEHQARHKELHEMLDELVSDWLTDTGGLPSKGTILELMQWSYAQTVEPSTREDPAPLKDVVADAPPRWEREPVTCGGCIEHGIPEDEAKRTPVWSGLWTCPECNNRLCYDGPEAGKLIPSLQEVVPEPWTTPCPDCGRVPPDGDLCCEANRVKAVKAKLEPERQVMSRGINPIRPQRPSIEKVECPECHERFDTVPAKTVICPDCKTLFAPITGAVFGKVPA